ncbi:MAG: phosphonate C-P lyase system protein PhnL [Endozoicomonas sp.]
MISKAIHGTTHGAIDGTIHVNKRIIVEGLSKTFVLHNRHDGNNGPAKIPVLADISLHVAEGECLALHGMSGTGKSTLLKSLYGNYRINAGRVSILGHRGWINLADASPREVTDLRKHSLGYVSQFLRVIPRVSALQVTMQPLLDLGEKRDTCEQKAAALLQQLNLPERLWGLPPSTFSGGEQQRVNIARGFMVDYPVMLLDEPTASLDPKNTDVVIELIDNARQRGAAIAGIFHDESVRSRVADRVFHFQGQEEQPCY